jgi:hypothetical protein
LALAPVSSNAVIKIEKTDYAIGFATTPIEQNKTASTQAVMTKVAISAPLGIASGGTVSDPNSAAQVSLPASGLVDAAGAAATGNVTVKLSVIDPKSNAAAMPGDYTTSAGTSIESFGAIKVTLLSSTGAALNLAANKTATIRIPVSGGATPDATIPLFYFSETTGKWVEDGTATLQGTAPNQYYEGTVTHFTYWNADRPLETIYVNGCLKDAAGAPVVNAGIESIGIDYTGTGRATTDATGKFKVAMKKNALASILAVNGSNVVSVGPSMTDITLSACLVVSAPAAPIILVQPTNVTVASNSSAVLSVSASPSNLQYQWFKNGTAVVGANSSYLQIQGAGSLNGDSYTVRVSNAQGSVTSNPAVVTVIPATITIYAQPVSVTSVIGGSANFSVVANLNNFGPLSYQWRKNGVAITGATTSNYSIAAVAGTDNGAQYSVVITGGGVSVTSNNATLTVTQAAAQITPLEQMRATLSALSIPGLAERLLENVDETSGIIAGGNSTCTTGTQITTLDNAPLSATGIVLPTGNHQLKLVANNCSNTGAVQNGTILTAYSFNNLNGSPLNGNAITTLSNFKDTVIGYFDITVNGTVGSTYQTSVTGANTLPNSSSTVSQTIVLTPDAGASAIDNATTRTSTIVSGSVSQKTINTRTYTTNVYGFNTSYTSIYNNLSYTLLGDTYVISGTLSNTYSFTSGGTSPTYPNSSGQVNVTRNGLLVGFLFYGADNLTLMINIGGVITPFFVP